MPQDVAKALADLLAHPAPHRCGLALRRAFVLADAEDEERRAEEAGGIENHGDRSAQPVDDQAGEPRATELCARPADLQLRVPVDEFPPVDEFRQIRLVRDVEEDGRDPDEETDAVELPDRQRVERVGDRNRGEQSRTCEVTGDEDGTAPQPVDPHARGQADEQKGEELDNVKRRDLEHACTHDNDRGERQRKLAELRAELADGLGRPELQEVRVPPETSGRPESHELSVSSAVGVEAGARSM